MKTKFFLLMFIAIAAFTSCETGADEAPLLPAEITFADGTTPSATIAPAGETKTIKFSSTQSWKAAVESDKSWCTISPTSGNAGESISITITINKNETSDERTAKVTITSDDEPTVFTVTQKQNDVFSFKGVPSDSLVSDESQFEITVSENIGTPTVTLSDEVKDWVTYSIGASTKAVATTVITFTVAENTVQESRTGKITITSGGKPEEFTITQVKDELSFTGMPTVDLMPTENMFKITMLEKTETTTVTISDDAKDWVMDSIVVPTEQASMTVVMFTVKANTLNESRSTTITITNDGKSEEFTITQKREGETFTFTGVPTEELFASKNKFDIIVSENMGTPTVTLSDEVKDWVEFSIGTPTKTIAKTVITFTVAENTSEENSRTGKITITSGGKAEEFTITQAKFESSEMSTDTEELSVIAESGSSIQEFLKLTAKGKWRVLTVEDDLKFALKGWITLSDMKGEDNEDISVTIANNGLRSDRVGNIFFQSVDFPAEDPIRVVVRQAASTYEGLTTYHNLGFGYDATGEYGRQSYVKSQVLDWDKMDARGYIAPVNNIHKSEFKSITGSSMSEYQDDLSVKAGVSAGASTPVAGFSLSVEAAFASAKNDYKETEYATRKGFVKTQVIKLNGTATVDRLRECLTDRAYADIVEGDMSADDVIKTYGTFIVTGFSIGGVYEYNMSAIRTSKQKSTDISVAVSASFNAGPASGGVSAETAIYNDLRTEAHDFTESYSTNGGVINKDFDEWAASLKPDNWTMVDFEGDTKLLPIWELLPDGARKDDLLAVASAKHGYAFPNGSKSSVYRFATYVGDNKFTSEWFRNRKTVSVRGVTSIEFELDGHGWSQWNDEKRRSMNTGSFSTYDYDVEEYGGLSSISINEFRVLLRVIMNVNKTYIVSPELSIFDNIDEDINVLLRSTSHTIITSTIPGVNETYTVEHAIGVVGEMFYNKKNGTWAKNWPDRPIREWTSDFFPYFGDVPASGVINGLPSFDPEIKSYQGGL